MNKIKLKGFSDYEIEAWLERLGSNPIKTIKSEDVSGSYEMEKFSILELENGKFATVYESGCSCYDSSDAQIELHPDLKSAEDSFDKWEKSRRIEG